MTLALIDCGAGNLHSVANALAAAGAVDVAITNDARVVAQAERIVLPGVGAFGACMSALRAIPDMVDTLERRVRDGDTPFLGICVGMQLLAEAGDEHGEHSGLGWFAGRVTRLAPADHKARVPHMGWNDVTPRAHPLIAAGEAYFLHSYAYAGDGVVATTDHGGPVTAAIARDNIVGVQFHPEKSQRYGIALLERFLAWRR
ncbi:MAG: imidazole glycerol phosphate synthase subunit HisH [Pseudomonadota bacterium]